MGSEGNPDVEEGLGMAAMATGEKSKHHGGETKKIGDKGAGEDEELDFGPEVESLNAVDLIRQLEDDSAVGAGQQQPMKWHEKVDLITKIGKVCCIGRGRGEGEKGLRSLMDVMKGKNVNVHVLRASVVGIGR